MTGKEYRSVVDWTVRKCSERSDKPIDTVRAVCKNLGAELPDGDVREISEVLKTNDYMGWRSCSINDAKFCAEIGVTAIGIDDDKIVIITDKADKNNPSMLTKNSTDDIIMTVTDETPALAVGNMQFYSYSYGCGGSGGTGGSGGSCPPSGGGIMEEDYIIALRDIFDFSSSTADLIRSLYDKVDKKFPSESKIYKAWKCARLLSVFQYDGGKFDIVASSVVSLSKAQAYFTGTLGFSLSEYNQLKIDIQNQHERSRPDFAHMQYALAARLTYILDLTEDNEILWAGYTIAGEDVSYMGGWLGDAVIAEDTTTSMKDDDYCADLDAEIVYRYIIEGRSSIHALNIYYSELSRNGNRAIKFKSYISYKTVQEKVFYYLIDESLISSLTLAIDQKDAPSISYYSNLLKNENYHWDVISQKYPDTYNFLKSLDNGLPHIGKYI